MAARPVRAEGCGTASLTTFVDKLVGAGDDPGPPRSDRRVCGVAIPGRLHWACGGSFRSQKESHLLISQRKCSPVAPAFLSMEWPRFRAAKLLVLGNSACLLKPQSAASE